MFLSKFPRVRLMELPSPLQHLPRYGRLIGHDAIYVKRDDLLSLGMGGNKLRNLEFWMGEALTENADVIIAMGGLQSNQCRLTAAACAKLGLECVLVHNDNEPAIYQGNMLLNHLAGAKSVFLGPMDETERSRQASLIAGRLREEGRHPYIIGNPRIGALGYVNAALELHEQANRLGVDLKHVVIVGAMAPTCSGFLYGTALLGHPFHVHVISVEYEAEYLRSLIEDICSQVIDVTGIRPAVDVQDVMTIYDDYLGDGYAKPTAGSVQTVYDLAQTEGVFLENVYTSKTLWGLRQLVERGIIPEAEAVCFIHTGGCPALFSQAELFQPK